MSKVKAVRGKKATTAEVEHRTYNIREVAAIAGTSVATVSRALGNSPEVSQQTRKHVREIVERLGYTPNAQPAILRNARTNLIVALVGNIANPFFSEVIRGIDIVARRNGYSVLLGDTQYDQTAEMEYWRLVATKQADGIITLLPRLQPRPAGAPIPVVNAGERLKDSKVTSVYVNNTAAAATATEYLVSLGHREIAMLSGPLDTPVCADRYSGYKRALTKAGIEFDPRLFVTGDFSVESGVHAVRELLKTEVKFTALFCANDEMAMGAILAIKESGRRVPGDISVVGFDDIQFARFSDPPLTTIAQPKMELGSEAMTLLLKILQDRSTPPQKRVLPTQLIIRASTGKPPR
jgi:LacI family repressor for deo operon, udp, cdd, tsx, nupC, and nupG